MSCNRIAIAVGVGDEQIRGNVCLDSNQGIVIDKTVAPGETVDLGITVDPEKLTGFYAQSNGDLTIKLGKRSSAIKAGIPALWYEGIGSAVEHAVCPDRAEAFVVNLGEDPVDFSLRISRRLEAKTESRSTTVNKKK